MFLAKFIDKQRKSCPLYHECRIFVFSAIYWAFGVRVSNPVYPLLFNSSTHIFETLTIKFTDKYKCQ